jgi:hypothetical protein
MYNHTVSSPGGVGVVVGVPAQRELGADLHRVRHAQQLQVRDLRKGRVVCG